MHADEDLDVLVIGAGLSGIAAGYHLQRRLPHLRYAILEARAAIGGTWDLFRYPGVRSDSDMYTLGYSFAPWPSAQAIADGASIRAYIESTARSHGIDRHIRFDHRVVAARWSSEAARWSVEVVRADGTTCTLRARFLFACSGYYAYDAGYTPAFAGTSDFAGRIVHPQQWPSDLDVRGQRVVVIGSGATAVTLVPALVQQGARVTMLQRSPTYVASLPAVDPIARLLRRVLPDGPAHDLIRWKNVSLSNAFYTFCRRFPGPARRWLERGVAQQLGDADAVARHFHPRYDPWDQRLCLVPDGDLFKVVRAGQAEVVTDEIERFTRSGLALRSGQVLDADVVVTATGLRIQLFGGARLEVDGRVVDPSTLHVYKGAMFSDVPNFAFAMGYTNASWTLKTELIARYVCRLLAHLEDQGQAWCVARAPADVGDEPVIDFQSGYVQRALPGLPRQGRRVPWRLYQNYLRDSIMLRWRRLDDPALEFGRPLPVSAAASAAAGSARR
ncbi:MAG: NAD(P)/FAD-dependent oxidoreductase [Kofleriaceae bacterium]|jgi:monooxygenase|nr:NAD(P)/FAD-dependent oxidoreductase [Kofleriaceae bacterium]MBP6838410.1 NAD(P)/FAD-dependent oxidoreductase [Kofleriaceae bacterium]MBP9203444.1 NAD(P)/FAD-dependent oxidoreductase [Kofleriaceae bacterium]